MIGGHSFEANRAVLFPTFAKVAQKLFGELVARTSRPTLRIATLTGLERNATLFRRCNFSAAGSVGGGAAHWRFPALFSAMRRSFPAAYSASVKPFILAMSRSAGDSCTLRTSNEPAGASYADGTVR